MRKSITFCKRLGVQVLGVIENMAGFVCPHCGEITNVLLSGGGFRIAADMDVPYLGSIPMDPRIAEAYDQGKPLPRRRLGLSPPAGAMLEILKPIESLEPRPSAAAAAVLEPERRKQPCVSLFPSQEGISARTSATVKSSPSWTPIRSGRRSSGARTSSPRRTSRASCLNGLPNGVPRSSSPAAWARAPRAFSPSGGRVVVGAAAETPERVVASSWPGGSSPARTCATTMSNHYDPRRPGVYVDPVLNNSSTPAMSGE